MPRQPHPEPTGTLTDKQPAFDPGYPNLPLAPPDKPNNIVVAVGVCKGEDAVDQLMKRPR